MTTPTQPLTETDSITEPLSVTEPLPDSEPPAIAKLGSITGLWFDGSGSQVHAARLTLDVQGWVTLSREDQEDEGEKSSYPLSELHFSNRISNTVRSIHLPDGSCFDTSDNDAVDAWLKQRQPKYRNAMHRFESTWHLMLLALLVVAFGSAWIALEGLSLVAAVITERLPASIGTQLGERSLAALDQEVFLPSRLDATSQNRINSYFQPALKTFPDLPLKVVFRDGGELGPNAFALPDGTLVFTDQLIALSATDEELLAILAHEIGHVAGQHSLKAAVRNAMTNFVLMAISGNATLGSELLMSAPLFMLEQTHSRQYEEDADHFALGFLLSHALHPEHFVNIMNRMDRADTCIPEADEDLIDYDAYYHHTLACYRKLTTLSHDNILALPATKSSEFWGYTSSHPATPERLKKFSAAAR